MPETIPRALISGCATTVLSEDEEAWFRDARPWGLILFARNIESRDQIRHLTGRFRSLVDRATAPVLVDQEGGRVRRLRPPLARAVPAAASIRAIYDEDKEKGREAAYLSGRILAEDLRPVGINVDCVPVADVPVAGSHDIIGDRAYGADPDAVADLARQVARGVIAGGVHPVVKHVPGHGRAVVDSHKALPVVEDDIAALEASDFVPFRALADLPMAMTAHCVYSAIDGDAPATLSSTVIGEVIRGRIGFDGLLMSDDISMGALSGNVGDRSRRAIAAGCDVVLHCNGDLDEMKAVVDAVPELSDCAKRRADAAEKVPEPAPCDIQQVVETFETLLGRAIDN